MLLFKLWTNISNGLNASSVIEDGCLRAQTRSKSRLMDGVEKGYGESKRFSMIWQTGLVVKYCDKQITLLRFQNHLKIYFERNSNKR